MDGDPFTDFDVLVRTSGVLRGGVPHTTDDLVAGSTPAAGRRAGPVDWGRERHLMLRDGCCQTAG